MMRSHWPATLGSAAVIIIFIVIVTFQLNPDSLVEVNPIKAIMDKQATCSPVPTSEISPKGSTYMMLLSFKDQAPLNSIYQVANSTIALKDKCLHPITRIPYIRSIRGGRDTSLDQTDSGRGTIHAFIIEFDSTDHRDYFVDFDPAHKAFHTEIQPLLVQSPTIIDFTTGRY